MAHLIIMHEATNSTPELGIDKLSGPLPLKVKFVRSFHLIYFVAASMPDI